MNKIEKISILRKVEVTVKNVKTLEAAKIITIECIEASKINEECKIKMITDAKAQKTLIEFLRWFYNAILAFEDCRIIK